MSAGVGVFILFIFVVDIFATVVLCREYRRVGYDKGYTDGWRAKHGVPAGTRKPHELDANGNCPECLKFSDKSYSHHPRGPDAGGGYRPAPRDESMPRKLMPPPRYPSGLPKSNLEIPMPPARPPLNRQGHGKECGCEICRDERAGNGNC